MRSLSATSPEGHFRIYAAILEWLGNLLQVTEVKEREPHPKSLLAMCLRKVPACVEDIEAWETENSDNRAAHSISSTSDISLDMYGQLEAMGGYTGVGWRPIKQTMRAHAISHLRKGVSESLFQPTYVALLVRLCNHFGCVSEAACLATATRGTLPPPLNRHSCFDDNHQLEPLHTLLKKLDDADDTARRLVFDSLSTLLKQKRLPPSWLSSKALSTVLALALESVSSVNGGGAAVVDFLSTVTETLCLSNSDKSWATHVDWRQQTLISVVAGLTVAALNDNSGPNGTSKARANIWRRIYYVLDSTINRIRQQRHARKSELLVPVLARYLAVVDSQGTEESLGQQAEHELEELLAATLSGNQSQRQLRKAMLLICSITQGRSQAHGLLGHEYLSGICDKLDGLALPVWFQHGLRTDGSFLLAQKTKDLRDLAFAERQAQTGTMTSETKRVSTIFSGWRWEEGISEWILPSPKSKVAQQPNHDPTISEINDRTVSAASCTIVASNSTQAYTNKRTHHKQISAPVYKDENHEGGSPSKGQCPWFQGRVRGNSIIRNHGPETEKLKCTTAMHDRMNKSAVTAVASSSDATTATRLRTVIENGKENQASKAEKAKKNGAKGGGEGQLLHVRGRTSFGRSRPGWAAPHKPRGSLQLESDWDELV